MLRRTNDRKLLRPLFPRAARNVQIVILTCREQLFEDLGGRPLTLQPADSEELASA